MRYHAIQVLPSLFVVLSLPLMAGFCLGLVLPSRTRLLSAGVCLTHRPLLTFLVFSLICSCLFFSGESGGGKSKTRCLTIKTLREPSVSDPGKSSKLASQVPTAEFAVESFGNARTLCNLNASRFSKHTKLQFAGHGLPREESYRNCCGELNFHIFRYLVAGTTPEDSASTSP